MYAVTVRLEVPAEEFGVLLECVKTNAIASRNELGCKQFDVCTDAHSRPIVFLYELYDDANSFADHLASAHFKAFISAIAPLRVSQQVCYFDRLDIER